MGETAFPCCYSSALRFLLRSGYTTCTSRGEQYSTSISEKYTHEALDYQEKQRKAIEKAWKEGGHAPAVLEGINVGGDGAVSFQMSVDLLKMSAPRPCPEWRGGIGRGEEEKQFFGLHC